MTCYATMTDGDGNVLTVTIEAPTYDDAVVAAIDYADEIGADIAILDLEAP